MKSIEDYSNTLRMYLQNTVTVKCNNKVLKTGKLKLFNIKQYFIKLYIETSKGEIKIIELPYPYDVYSVKNKCVLNYKLNTLANNSLYMMSRLKNISSSNALKIYDQTVDIISLN
jgi:hypothetical protein